MADIQVLNVWPMPRQSKLIDSTDMTEKKAGQVLDASSGSHLRRSRLVILEMIPIGEIGLLLKSLTSIANVGVHCAKVGLEFGSLVAKGVNLSVPSGAQLVEAQVGFGKVFFYAQNGAWKKVTVKEAGQVLGAGVAVHGFFLAGEIVERESLVWVQNRCAD
ncbi:UNVERIFIED_CONTAM: hypothetical protein HDU68_008352 [Siphonaria sp. JEL0065]|nr:hypothetical protein HDU68_008352 [Siphonaria sp. JEL0065]